MPYAGDGGSAPAGWLYCRGQLVSTGGANAALYALVGHKFNGGADPGGSQFRLPDLREVFALGTSDTSLSLTVSNVDAGGPTGGGTYSDGAWNHQHSANSLEVAGHQHASAQGYVMGNHSHGAGTLYSSHTHTILTTTKKIQADPDWGVDINRRNDLSAPSSTTISGSTANDGQHYITGSSGPASLTLTLTGTSGTATMPYLVTNYIVKL